MKTVEIKRRFLSIFPYGRTVEKPLIRRTIGLEGLRPVKGTRMWARFEWRCTGHGCVGLGRSPSAAWQDWERRL
jgi:hypothetical protein